METRSHSGPLFFKTVGLFVSPCRDRSFARVLKTSFLALPDPVVTVSVGQPCAPDAKWRMRRRDHWQAGVDAPEKRRGDS